MRWLIVAALLVTAGPARADKSRQTATTLSVAGTAVSSALVIAAFAVSADTADVNAPLLYTGIGTAIVTPSLGEIYAGQYLTWGMGIRAAAGALAVGAIAFGQETVTCPNAASSSQTCQQLTGNAVALLGAAAIAYIGGAAYDVMDASDAVDRYNLRHGFGYALAPTIVPSPRGAVPALYFSATY